MRRLLKKLPDRRHEARVPLTPAEHERHQRWHLLLMTVLLALGLWATLAVNSPAIPGLRPGAPSPVSIQAGHSLSFPSTLLTEQARLSAQADASTIVYRDDPSILIEQRAQLVGLIQSITQIRADARFDQQTRVSRLTGLPNSSLVISSTLASEIAELSAEQWERVSVASLDLYDRAVREYTYVISLEALTDLRRRSLPYWSALATRSPAEARLALLLSVAFLKSNQYIDEEATQLRREAAARSVKPIVVSIQAGESIVRQGDLITPEIQERLEALGELRGQTNWLRIAGEGALAGLVATVFGLYLAGGPRRLWMSDRSLLVIYGLFILTILFARLLLPIAGNWSFAFPMATTVLLLAALFDSGLAIMAAGLLSLLIAFLGESQFALGATLFLGSLAGVFTVGRPSRSLTFLLAGLAIAGMTAVCQLAFLLMTFGGPSTEQLLVALSMSGLNGALSAILALGLYNFAGHLAGIITPFQLMELAHPSQPLLRKLMREAPGTYYHSVAVGNLAESAAEAVGADALLLRVAAYYHDIGKTIRPYFFSDNQSNRENVHDELDPHTSAQIIADHVREGVRLARDAGVPRQIIGFISTHHGTMVIKHFYQLALQRHDSVNIDEFRYPGPKPGTREQAILMLADSVEATVRAKSQHGQIIPARESHGNSNGRSTGGMQTLEELVDAIVDDRVHGGQLDECALTISELASIRRAFIGTLQGIYHPRVDYAPQIVKMP